MENITKKTCRIPLHAPGIKNSKKHNVGAVENTMTQTKKRIVGSMNKPGVRAAQYQRFLKWLEEREEPGAPYGYVRKSEVDHMFVEMMKGAL